MIGMAHAHDVRHLATAAALLAATAVCVALFLTVSIWFFLPAPLLLSGAYAAWIGMSPSRFADSVTCDDGCGGSRVLPF